MTPPSDNNGPEAEASEGGAEGISEPDTPGAAQDPRATSHPAGEKQARENAENEPAG